MVFFFSYLVYTRRLPIDHALVIDLLLPLIRHPGSRTAEDKNFVGIGTKKKAYSA